MHGRDHYGIHASAYSVAAPLADGVVADAAVRVPVPLRRRRSTA